jgi:hypothetical protein
MTPDYILLHTPEAAGKWLLISRNDDAHSYVGRGQPPPLQVGVRRVVVGAGVMEGLLPLVRLDAKLVDGHLRRAARTKGLRVKKSKRSGGGGYMLLDARGTVLAGGGFELSADDVLTILGEDGVIVTIDIRCVWRLRREAEALAPDLQAF